MLELLTSLILLGLLGGMISNSPVVAQAAWEGLTLCGRQIIPSLFPFFVVSALLLGQPGAFQLARPLRILTKPLGVRSRHGALILLLSWCGGYAVCASCIGKAVREKNLSPRDAHLLLILGTTSSPGFTIGTVGGILLGNLRFGVLLYLSGLLANVVCAFLVSLFPFGGSAVIGSGQPQNSVSLSQAIGSGIQSSLTVCGCVVFFRVLSSLGADLLGLTGWGRGMLAGLFEISCGCAQLSALGGGCALYSCCALLSLLSISVLLQIQGLLAESCSIKCLVITRPFHLLLSLMILRGFLCCFPRTLPAYSSLSPRLIIASRATPDTALMIFILCCMALHLLQQKSRPETDG